MAGERIIVTESEVVQRLVVSSIAWLDDSHRYRARLSKKEIRRTKHMPIKSRLHARTVSPKRRKEGSSTCTIAATPEKTEDREALNHAATMGPKSRLAC